MYTAQSFWLVEKKPAVLEFFAMHPFRCRFAHISQSRQILGEISMFAAKNLLSVSMVTKWERAEVQISCWTYVTDLLEGFGACKIIPRKCYQATFSAMITCNIHISTFYCLLMDKFSSLIQPLLSSEWSEAVIDDTEVNLCQSMYHKSFASKLPQLHPLKVRSQVKSWNRLKINIWEAR